MYFLEVNLMEVSNNLLLTSRRHFLLYCYSGLWDSM